MSGRNSSPGRIKSVHLSISHMPILGPTQSTVQWVSGALFLGVKQPGCEAIHSHPTNAEVKKTWIYVSTVPYVFMA
jgi:hypothetical protein